MTKMPAKVKPVRLSRFTKKKQEDGTIFISAKILRGKLTGKQVRSVCNALNEAVQNVLFPTEGETKQ